MHILVLIQIYPAVNRFSLRHPGVKGGQAANGIYCYHNHTTTNSISQCC